jgi:hypothetical protein
MFNKHVLKSKHIKEDRDHLTSYLEKHVTHKCILCLNLLLCDRRPLRSHLIRVHQIKTIEEYCEKTGCSLSLNNKKLSNNIQNYPLSHEIGNFCSFECKACNSKFETFVALRAHGCLKGSKGKNLNRYQQVFNYLSKAVVHECGICKEKILCDNKIISVHLFGKHKRMNLTEYAKRTKKTFVPGPAVRKQTRRATMSNESSNNNSPSSSKRAESKPPEETKVKRKQQSLKGSGGILCLAPLSSIIADLCQYRCKQCKSSFCSFPKLRWHHCLKEAKRPRGRVFEFLCKTVAYECAICKTRLLCDKDFIRSHLSSKHKGMGLNQYVNTLRDKGRDALSSHQ